MRKFFGFLCLAFFGLLSASSFFSGCKSEPPPNEVPILASVPLEPPSFSLAFKGIEADDPAHIRVFFDLEAKPPLPAGSSAKLASWRIEIDGQDAGSAFSLANHQLDVLSPNTNLALNMDIGALVEKGLAPRDDYSIALIAEFEYALPSAGPERIEVRTLAAFPGVQPPRFTVAEIAVIKAELINTRFRVALKIDNPNPFPIELSSFSYSLYGNGQFWANGAEKDAIRIREKSTLEGNILLMMNFIDMNRSLLDQITRLEDVNYRFTGDVLVSTGIAYLPSFNDGFEVSGYSRVLER